MEPFIPPLHCFMLISLASRLRRGRGYEHLRDKLSCCGSSLRAASPSLRASLFPNRNLVITEPIRDFATPKHNYATRTRCGENCVAFMCLPVKTLSQYLFCRRNASQLIKAACPGCETALCCHYSRAPGFLCSVVATARYNYVWFWAPFDGNTDFKIS